MSKQFKFSKSSLDKLKPTNKEFEVSDPTRPGLRCRIRPNGTKSVYVLKAKAGKRIKYTIGLVTGLGGKDLEILYRNGLAFIEGGKTAKEAKVVKAELSAKNASMNEALSFTVGEAVKFTKNRKKKGGSPLSANSISAYDRLLANSISNENKKLSKEVVADWKNLPIRELAFEQIEERFDLITLKLGKYAANNFLRLMRSVWHYVSVRKKSLELDEWPVEIFENTWHKELRRKSYIVIEDLPTWYEAVMNLSTGQDPELARDYLLFAICTGLRRREITDNLLVENVDLEKGIFTVDISKTDKLVQLPLNTVTREIVERRIKVAGTSKVFPIVEPKKFIKRVAKASVAFTSHDLRRSFATYANMLDVPKQAIKTFLTHASGEKEQDVTDGYIMVDFERLRVYSQRIADFITTRPKKDDKKVATLTRVN